jgi:hypothetical protein
MSMIAPAMLVFWLCATGERPRENPHHAQLKQPPKTVEVPLESMSATWGQDKLTYIFAGFQLLKDGSKKFSEPYGFALSELRGKHRTNTSNVLLVQAADLAGSVEATHRVFLKGQSADKVVQAEAKSTSQRKYWLAVYLGQGTASYRAVVSCTRTANQIRLSYKEDQSATEAIAVEQFLWAPLGTLEPGPYVIELFDAGRGELDLSRRVSVP